MKKFKAGWWSAGITSAVACKMGLELYGNVRLYYIETGKAHPDNARFKADCEKWYGQEIMTVQNTKGYKNPLDVVYRERYINGPGGAHCTKVLKKQVREMIENAYKPGLFNDEVLTNQIFGYEFDRKQINRAIRFMQEYPYVNALFPLIEKGLNKNNCAAILLQAGIELPEMYKMGYSNNNCIGCFKGGKGYWNKIRKDFPDVFEETAKAERHISHSCIKGVFLDELDPDIGVEPEVVVPECGIFCGEELSVYEDVNLEKVLQGHMTIYDAAKRLQ